MWYNKIVVSLLRSPLHGLLGRGILAVTYTGRRSGMSYTTPVNFVQADGVYLVTSYRKRTWWRNLRGGAPVKIIVEGKELQALGDVIEDETGVVSGLQAYLLKAPNIARYFHVRLDEQGRLNLGDLQQSARERVIVRIQILS